MHIRDFPFENMGLEHNPGLDAGELMRSWYAEERRDFLSWVSRRGPPPLAHAARLALTAKAASESFTSAYAPAERALERLDALLPARDPIATLGALVEQLRAEEIDFLEGGSEVHEFGGATFDRPAPRGAAWAASLALAMRPQLFGLGAAPLALAGLMPRSVFRSEPEEPVVALLRAAACSAAHWAGQDLHVLHKGLEHGLERLSGRYASSRAPGAWGLLLGLGALTRAELARALDVTARTASQIALALVEAKLVAPPASERPLQPVMSRC
ncbi:MarR family transcriptional regulator [Sphingobium xenophagum]